MKLWVDDVRPAPEGYFWCKSVNEAINTILANERWNAYCLFEEMDIITLIDIDHDAGDYAQYGGDYIKILDWLEETDRDYPIRIHSMNPVGRGNMRRIIRKNGWKEID